MAELCCQVSFSVQKHSLHRDSWSCTIILLAPSDSFWVLFNVKVWSHKSWQCVMCPDFCRYYRRWGRMQWTVWSLVWISCGVWLFKREKLLFPVHKTAHSFRNPEHVDIVVSFNVAPVASTNICLVLVTKWGWSSLYRQTCQITALKTFPSSPSVIRVIAK